MIKKLSGAEVILIMLTFITFTDFSVPRINLLGTENTIIVPEINMGGISSGGIQAKERR